MLASSALRISQQDTFAKRLKTTHKTLLAAIKHAAKGGSVAITIPGEKEWSKAERQQLYTLLQKDGYSVEEKTLPDSKIEPDRLIVTIAWSV